MLFPEEHEDLMPLSQDHIEKAARAYLDVVCDWINASDERASFEAALEGGK